MNQTYCNKYDLPNGYVKIKLEIKEKDASGQLDWETLLPINGIIKTVSITGELKDGYAKASGQIYNELDLSKCPSQLQQICSAWETYHLNDIKAGTRDQEEYLNQFPRYEGYKWACDQLKDAGLYSDRGYVYGTRWLARQVSDEEIRYITSLFFGGTL